jgi:hypothetical protein
LFIVICIETENCFVKEKGQKRKSIRSGCAQAGHQIAGGIKEGFVRMQCVYAERFG